MSTAERRIIDVALGERGYPIVIGEGVIGEAGEWIERSLSPRRAIIVADTHTSALFGATVQSSLQGAGIPSDMLTVPAGEGSKSLARLESLLEQMLERRPDRKTLIVALGGGVIGDLAGFAASILLRGVPFVQIPTTLLAQVDSSVGGKTAVNSRHGKNLIGSFYQPRLVLADTAALSTLPRRELLAGYAEVVKYGLIDQPDFFVWLEAFGKAALEGDAEKIASIIATCCEAKAAVVAQDEKESGLRALLNLGHTFGHALEKASGFGEVMLHGESVALGCLMALRLSVMRGLATQEDFNRLSEHYRAVGLPVDLSGFKVEWQPDMLAEYCLQDKKAVDGKLVFILLRGIGQAFIADNVTLREVSDTFAQFIR